MIRCDLRGIECSCEPSECRASKPSTLAATIMVPSRKTQLAACLFGGFLIGAVVFVVAARAEPYQKNIDLINQEVTANAYRR
jgi:hypothetical protein